MKVGNKVRIVNYGHNIMVANEENWEPQLEDIRPDLVGQEGIIREVKGQQGNLIFALTGPDKVSWYFEDQLELVDEQD